MTDHHPTPGFQPPPPIGVTTLQPPSFGSSGGEPPRASRGAKIAASVLGVLLVAVAVVAAVLVSNSRSDADDAKAELADVRESLDSLESDSGSIEERVDELLDEQEAAEQVEADLRVTIDEQAGQIEELTAQVEESGDAAALQQQLDDLQAELDRTSAELEQSQADLAAANEALDAAESQPAAVPSFSVEPAAIRPTLGNFSVVTNRVTCEGFADPADACPATLPLSGRFIQDGPQLFMEFANVAKVPIGTFDGFNYAGSTPATNEASSLCGDQVISSTMTVQIAPVRFTVDPATQVVTATAFSFTWTIASDESANCIGSTRTYTGTVSL